MTKVVLPELGEGVTEAVVSFWHFEEGQTVKEGQDLVEMATDKATFNVPVPATGVVKQRLFEEGCKVKVGEVLAIID